MITHVDQKETGAVKEMAKIRTCVKGDLCLNLEYRLMRAECPECIYFISVSDTKESEYIFAGASEEEAISLFEILAAGEITPCTACDIAKDILQMRSEEK